MKRIKFAIVAFYLSLFVGLALYDEKPDPGLQLEMARTLPETIEPGNAWIVFLGFDSPKGVSPYAYGKQMMQKLKDAVSTGKSYTEYLTLSIDGSKLELQFQGNYLHFTARKMMGCFHTLRHMEVKSAHYVMTT